MVFNDIGKVKRAVPVVVAVLLADAPENRHRLLTFRQRGGQSAIFTLVS